MNKKVAPATYLAQYDSETDQGYRMCRTSTYSMALEAYKPGVIRSGLYNGVRSKKPLVGQLDDLYLKRVRDFGDTTETEAQRQALLSYGQKSTYRQDVTVEELCKFVDATNKPVPVGILHKGHISQPTGGGHWILFLGYDGAHLVFHDPAGELDLINGGYAIGGSGKYVKYTRENFRRRFELDSNGRFSPGRGWATFLQ